VALITESQLSARLAHCGPFRRWSPFSAESRHSASTAGTALRAPHLPFAIPIGTGSAPRKDGARRPGAWPRTNEDQAARAGRCSGKAESCRRVGDDAPARLERRQGTLYRSSKAATNTSAACSPADAIAILRHARDRPTRDGEWVRSPLTRKPTKVDAIALANKTARIVK